MVRCWGCGNEIETDRDIQLAERVGGNDIWVYNFHGWRCLAEAMIERGMIEVVVRGVGSDEAGGSL